MNTPTMRTKQRGAVLFIALIMLLLITLLAVTSMREVSLEARVTGNLIEQKRLLSAAESALRESERRIVRSNLPPDVCIAGSTDPVVCVEKIADDYDTDFTSATAYSGIDGETSLDRNASWYIRDTGIISSSDPECFLTGKNCVTYYEANSQATKESSQPTCDAKALCIRSVVAAIYD